MNNWFSLLTFTELVEWTFYKFGIASSKRYHENCGLVRRDIIQIKSYGCSVSRNKKLIQIVSSELGGKFKYLIRPKTSDRKVFKQVIIDKEYSPIIKIINEQGDLETIKYIVDAGSNIGLASLYFNFFMPNAKLISLEPDEGNFDLQMKNIILNNLLNKMDVLKRALWSNNSDKLYLTSDFRDGDNWSKSVAKGVTGSDSFITAITLDDIRQRIGSENYIDILKIDIEGSESVLFDSPSFITTLRQGVRFLCLEIHDELNIREKIYGIFRDINFDFVEAGETCFCINKNIF